MSFDDLPADLGSTGDGEPTVLLLEATGVLQDERSPEHINLCAADVHSDRRSPLRAAADQLPVHSYERWVRLRFVAPTPAISRLTLWLPNLDPRPGWQLLIGTADNYRAPISDRSNLAMFTPPTSPDDAVPLTVSSDRFGRTSQWIVLQATWSPSEGDASPLQDALVQFQFAWAAG